MNCSITSRTLVVLVSLYIYIYLYVHIYAFIYTCIYIQLTICCSVCTCDLQPIQQHALQQQHHQLQQLMVLMLRYCEKVINSSSFVGYDDPQNDHISTLAWMKLKRVALTTEISCAPHAFAFRSLTPPRVCAFPSLSPLLPPPSSRNHRCASMPSSWCPFREPPCWQMSRQTRFPMHMSRDGSTPPSQATLGENLRVCVSLC